MNVPTLLAVSGSTLSVGLVIGGVISNLRKGNKDQQSEVIGLQQNEIAAFKSSNERLKQDNAALSAEVSTLKGSNQDLKDIAQQTPEIKKLIKEITASRILLSAVVAHLGVKNAKKN